MAGFNRLWNGDKVAFKVDVSAINQPLVVQRSVLHSNSELNDTVFSATQTTCVGRNIKFQCKYCVFFILTSKNQAYWAALFPRLPPQMRHLSHLGGGVIFSVLFSQNSVFCVINRHTSTVNCRSSLNPQFCVINRHTPTVNCRSSLNPQFCVINRHTSTVNCRSSLNPCFVLSTVTHLL